MTNNKIFVAYALALIACVTSLITASVMAGFATLPSPLMFVEHFGLALLFRASYKGLVGWDNVDWPWQTDAVVEAAAAPAVAGIDALEAQEDYADAA